MRGRNQRLTSPLPQPRTLGRIGRNRPNQRLPLVPARQSPVLVNGHFRHLPNGPFSRVSLWPPRDRPQRKPHTPRTGQHPPRPRPAPLWHLPDISPRTSRTRCTCPCRFWRPLLHHFLSGRITTPVQTSPNRPRSRPTYGCLRASPRDYRHMATNSISTPEAGVNGRGEHRCQRRAQRVEPPGPTPSLPCQRTEKMSPQLTFNRTEKMSPS